jgi:integrase
MAKIVLNVKSIQALKPKTTRVDYFDSGRGAIPGFHVRVTPSGEKTYSVLYRIILGGKSTLRRLTIGTVDATSLDEARDQAQDARRSASKGIDPAQQKVIERTAETFEDLAETFIKKHVSKKDSAYEDERMIRKYLIPKLKYTRAKDVTRAQVRALLDGIAEDAPVQANRVLAVIRKMYNYGISRDLVESNSCALIEPPGDEEARTRVLSDEELPIVWGAFETIEAREEEIVAKRIINAFRVRLITGQRGGEVDAMQWAEVDLKNRWWTIPADRSKNGKEHRVWLSDPIVRILEQEKERKPKDSKWVFAGRRKDSHVVEVKGLMKLVREEAKKQGVNDHWTLHDLRRTCATGLARLRVMPFVISRVLNHAQPDHGPQSQSQITAVYNQHEYREEQKAALETWAKHLMKTVKNLKAVPTHA